MARGIPQRLLDKALEVYAETHSIFKTAARVGLGASTVHRLLTARGIKCDGLQIFRDSIRKLPRSPQVRQEYEAGATESEIAKKYGVTPSSVHEALRKAGAKKRRRGNWIRHLSDEQVAEMRSLYEQLKTQKAVAIAMGIGEKRIARAFTTLGIQHRGRARGAAHGSWNGGKARVSGGYTAVLIQPEDSMFVMNNKGYVLEHRLVMARSLGRPLFDHETVHHINGVRNDNRIENLQLRTGNHGKGVVACCAKCGCTDIIYERLKG